MKEDPVLTMREPSFAFGFCFRLFRPRVPAHGKGETVIEHEYEHEYEQEQEHEHEHEYEHEYEHEQEHEQEQEHEHEHEYEQEHEHEHEHEYDLHHCLPNPCGCRLHPALRDCEAASYPISARRSSALGNEDGCTSDS